jgi:4-aminobutyrate aminotransferase / (S)-3-amino-2-methylpropionate transaminase / 5-aminovalerate transaminase
MNTNKSLLDRRLAAIPKGVATAHPIFAASARNAELQDIEGNTFIDFASGIAVLNTGHNHPRIIAAAQAQMNNFCHTAFQVIGYEPYIALAERLNASVPGPSLKKTLFVTTGAEANENAVKIARVATGRPNVIAFSGGFHGRTLLGLALTGKALPYKQGFGPFPAGVFHAPFPSVLHGISDAAALRAIEDLLAVETAPQDTAAIIIEPVQGEGGFYAASPEFLQAIRALCDRHGILLIVDEVQCGFARTGKLFAHEHAGIEADLVVMAKSLGGGLPLAAVTGREVIMDSVPPGGLGGTYGGSPIACAAALAVLDVIEEEALCARAESIGAALEAELNAVNETVSGGCFAEIRRSGAMVAAEVEDNGSGAGSRLVQAILAAGRAQGLLLLGCGRHGNVLRLLPPLTIEDPVLDEGLRRLRQAIGDARQIVGA